MKKLLLLSLIVAAVGCSSDKDDNFNTTSVSEKSLKEASCEFKENKGENKKTSVSLACDVSDDPADQQVQLNVIDDYMAKVDKALKTDNLDPAISEKLNQKKELAQTERARVAGVMAENKAFLAKVNPQEAPSEKTFKYYRQMREADITLLKEVHQCDVQSDTVVCEFPESEDDTNKLYDKLLDFVASSNVLIKFDETLEDEAKQQMEGQVKAALEMLKELK